jgi:hypothetical protein
MLQGYEGAWQYHIQFTPEEHAPAFLYGFYLALGHLARLFNLSVVTAWHAALFVSALILFLVVYGFIAIFLRDPFQRRVAYLLAIFGAGFDWTAFPFERLGEASGVPVDFKMPEAHLFFSALTYPHFSIGIALILIVFALALKLFETRRWRYAACAGVAIVALGIVYPFLMYLILPVIGGYWIYQSWRAGKILWRELGMIALMFALAAPLYVYYQIVLLTNPVFQTWNAQAVTLSPNPLHYVLAFGAMIGLAAPTFRKKQFDFLWIWIILAAALLYAPISAQRRFVEGVQVALAIGATAGLGDAILPRLEQTRMFRALAARPGYSTEGLRRLVVTCIIVILSMASGVVLLDAMMLTTIQQPDVFFRTRAELEAVDWLRDHTARTDVVFAAYPTGSLIPARAGNAVFIGQRYETNQFADKLAQTAKFFTTQTDDTWRRDLLARHRVAYVLFGASERVLGGFDATRADYLERVYSNSETILFRVRR